MSDLIVHGGRPLSGTITPSGNKNSVLPIFCATLLTDEPVTLLNVPDITDLNKLVAFFQGQGSQITRDRTAGTMRVDHSTFRPSLADDELPQDMRSTALLYPRCSTGSASSLSAPTPRAAPSACARSTHTLKSSAPSAR